MLVTEAGTDIDELCGTRFGDLNGFERRIINIASCFPRLHSTLLLQMPFEGLSGTESLALATILRRVAD